MKDILLILGFFGVIATAGVVEKVILRWLTPKAGPKPTRCVCEEQGGHITLGRMPYMPGWWCGWKHCKHHWKTAAQLEAAAFRKEA